MGSAYLPGPGASHGTYPPPLLKIPSGPLAPSGVLPPSPRQSQLRRLPSGGILLYPPPNTPNTPTKVVLDPNTPDEGWMVRVCVSLRICLCLGPEPYSLHP